MLLLSTRLRRFRTVSVLAGNDLDLARGDFFVILHFELGILDHERPDVIALSIHVEVTLWYGKVTLASELSTCWGEGEE